MKPIHFQDDFIAGALQLVFAKNWRADRALQTILRAANDLSFAERGDIAMAVQDIIRYWRILWACCDLMPDTSESALGKLIATWRILKKEPSSANLESAMVWRRYQQLQSSRRWRESIPDWLDEAGEKELGERWQPLLAALNKPAPQVLRANTLKGGVDELCGLLRKVDIRTDTVAWAPEAVVIEGYADLYHLPHFKQGWFEVQDAASQAVSHYLNPRPGMRVVDACAGNGGKSLHLAALMGNRGKILSLDVDGRKLAELSRRARRAGADIIEPRLITTSKTVKRLYDTADRVLLDVPCSGSGALRRNPEIKWRLQPLNLTNLLLEQQSILVRYSRMVKKNGLLVYATCSVFPSEGELQIVRFLTESKGVFSLLEEKRLSPDVEGFDGFYIAVLQRKV